MTSCQKSHKAIITVHCSEYKSRWHMFQKRWTVVKGCKVPHTSEAITGITAITIYFQVLLVLAVGCQPPQSNRSKAWQSYTNLLPTSLPVTFPSRSTLTGSVGLKRPRLPNPYGNGVGNLGQLLCLGSHVAKSKVSEFTTKKVHLHQNPRSHFRNSLVFYPN